MTNGKFPFLTTENHSIILAVLIRTVYQFTCCSPAFMERLALLSINVTINLKIQPKTTTSLDMIQPHILEYYISLSDDNSYKDRST